MEKSEVCPHIQNIPQSMKTISTIGVAILNGIPGKRP
jgi:hypothetical protein